MLIFEIVPPLLVAPRQQPVLQRVIDLKFAGRRLDCRALVRRVDAAEILCRGGFDEADLPAVLGRLRGFFTRYHGANISAAGGRGEGHAAMDWACPVVG